MPYIQTFLVRYHRVEASAGLGQPFGIFEPVSCSKGSGSLSSANAHASNILLLLTQESHPFQMCTRMEHSKDVSELLQGSLIQLTDPPAWSRFCQVTVTQSIQNRHIQPHCLGAKLCPLSKALPLKRQYRTRVHQMYITIFGERGSILREGQYCTK